MYLKILKELDWPPVYMVNPEQFEHVDGNSVRGCYGISNAFHRIFTVKRGLTGKVRANTIYHEIGHILFPSKPHWWIDLYGEKMARGGGKGYWSTVYGKTLEDLPSRARLVELSRRASKRMKR